MWHHHTKKTMFFGKLAYAIAPAIIVTSGIARLPIRRFILISVPVGIFQIAAFMLVGYYLGASYQVAQDYIEYPGIVITALLAVAVFVYFISAKYVARKLQQETKVEAEHLHIDTSLEVVDENANLDNNSDNHNK
jgi:membrane protein DedA with SNARE-associated domain